MCKEVVSAQFLNQKKASANDKWARLSPITKNQHKTLLKEL